MPVPLDSAPVDSPMFDEASTGYGQGHSIEAIHHPAITSNYQWNEEPGYYVTTPDQSQCKNIF